jgi:hypothetical protein
MSFNIGDKVIMSAEALENYGQDFADTVFTVEVVWLEDENGTPHVATRQHPVSRDALYDLVYADTGAEFGSSLYDWELRPAYTRRMV